MICNFECVPVLYFDPNQIPTRFWQKTLQHYFHKSLKRQVTCLGWNLYEAVIGVAHTYTSTLGHFWNCMFRPILKILKVSVGKQAMDYLHCSSWDPLQMPHRSQTAWGSYTKFKLHYKWLEHTYPNLKRKRRMTTAKSSSQLHWSVFETDLISNEQTSPSKIIIIQTLAIFSENTWVQNQIPYTQGGIIQLNKIQT